MLCSSTTMMNLTYWSYQSCWNTHAAFLLDVQYIETCMLCSSTTMMNLTCWSYQSCWNMHAAFLFPFLSSFSLPYAQSTKYWPEPEPNQYHIHCSNPLPLPFWIWQQWSPRTPEKTCCILENKRRKSLTHCIMTFSAAVQISGFVGNFCRCHVKNFRPSIIWLDHIFSEQRLREGKIKH